MILYPPYVKPDWHENQNSSPHNCIGITYKTANVRVFGVITYYSGFSKVNEGLKGSGGGRGEGDIFVFVMGGD